MAILTLVFGRDILETYEINQDRLVIGRADECEIVIDNLAVSRQHAVIEKKDAVFTLNDLQSNNGTFINGQQIIEPTTLNFGDEIGIGKHVLVFDSHSRKDRSVQSSSLGGAQPKMDMSERGTMFVGAEKMEKIQEKATAARKAHLEVKGEAGDTHLIPLGIKKVVFGKAGDCDVKIKGLFASGRHATIGSVESGFQILNHAALSPARVNGIRIDSALLCEGDVITIGKSIFVFHSER